jgi:hypothetical protein
VFNVPDMFLITLFKATTCLFNVWYFACVTCKFTDSTLVLFCVLLAIFGFVSCNVLVFLKNISMFLCLNKLVIFLIIEL